MRSRIALLLLSVILAAPACAQPSDITPLRSDLGARLFEAACSACHYRGANKTPFGKSGPPTESQPDELVDAILFGKAREVGEVGMPAYGPVLSDADVTRLVEWLRATAAKPQAPWPDLLVSVAHRRATGQREE